MTPHYLATLLILARLLAGPATVVPEAGRPGDLTEHTRIEWRTRG